MPAAKPFLLKGNIQVEFTCPHCNMAVKDTFNIVSNLSSSCDCCGTTIDTFIDCPQCKKEIYVG